MRNVILGLTILFGLFAGIPAYALTVSPAKLEVTVDPGATYHGEIELFNEQAENKTFFSSFENFEPRGDSGAPYFIGAKDGLATWLSAAGEVTLAPSERVVVPFSITVPANTAPGGYFAAVFFGSQPPIAQGGGAVSIGGKIGVLILLRVSGEIEESGGLQELVAGDGQRFWGTMPITLSYRLNNEGGDRVVPTGEITIKNTFRLTSATLLANENGGSVLPGSTRKFTVLWGDEPIVNQGEEVQESFFGTVKKQWSDFHFGWYTARLHLVWGESSQTAEAKYHFFIIPWQLLLLVALLLIVLFVIGRFGLRRYNNHIISQAMQRQ